MAPGLAQALGLVLVQVQQARELVRAQRLVQARQVLQAQAQRLVLLRRRALASVRLRLQRPLWRLV